MALVVGTHLGRYEIRSLLGTGGMGEVYLAKDTRLERTVALKVLPIEVAADGERMRRFVQEAKSASALNHPNIITIYEIGETGNTHFIATEYIAGETLHRRLQSEPLSLTSALDVAMQMASALQAAHSAGIVHRDIKPDNVMLRPDGLVKLLDFGIAKLTEKKAAPIDAEAATAIKAGTSPGLIIGTASYMSPEQARGQAVDARSDLFSFGVVLYEMLAGKPPFAGANAIETIGAMLHTEPAPLDEGTTPRVLRRIVEKCLRKDRDERYQTAKDLLADLKDIKQDWEFQNKLERTAQPHDETKTQILNAASIGEARSLSSAQTTAAEPKKRKFSFVAGALVLLLAAIVGSGIWYFANRISNTKRIESIAVLPFENGSGDANLDYLSDGVSESVIDRLSRLPQLKVIARSSSFRYRGQNLDLKEIADALGVQAIVTGRVVPRGDNYHIRVELVDVREDKQLWGENFSRKASDVQILQTDISREIAENLRLRLSGAQTQQLASQGTTNAQAYELLLKGRFFFHRSGQDNFRKALDFYEQAAVADPNYALAHAELAVAESGNLLAPYVNQKEALARTEAAARKALQLDKDLSQAHLAMGNVKRYLWEFQAAEQEYKRAIELNPNYDFAHSNYSAYLSQQGRHDEAIAEIKNARELNPLSFLLSLNVGITYFRARRYDEAIEAFKKGFELDDRIGIMHRRLGEAYAAKGMFQEAISAYQESLRLGSVTTEPFLGIAYAKIGERGKAEEISQKLRTDISPIYPAMLHAALGKRDEAFAELEKAYAERDGNLLYIAVEPSFDPLRADPRFQDLLRRVGLSQ
ncbi:MAG: protein kinase [Acidobacteria bacterium]|nr:protein kinase [Acidobacteriota bacterium]